MSKAGGHVHESPKDHYRGHEREALGSSPSGWSESGVPVLHGMAMLEASHRFLAEERGNTRRGDL